MLSASCTWKEREPLTKARLLFMSKVALRVRYLPFCAQTPNLQTCVKSRAGVFETCSQVQRGSKKHRNSWFPAAHANADHGRQEAAPLFIGGTESHFAVHEELRTSQAQRRYFAFLAIERRRVRLLERRGRFGERRLPPSVIAAGRELPRAHKITGVCNFIKNCSFWLCDGGQPNKVGVFSGL